MAAHELADLATSEMGTPATWWQVAMRWLDDQANRRAALTEVLEGLEAGTLMLLVGNPPESMVNDLADVMREALETREPEDKLGALASAWLSQQGILARDDIDPERLERSRFTVMGLLLVGDPEGVHDYFADGRSHEEQLLDIANLSTTMPPHVVEILEAIGRHHSDKVVAKAARREVLKVRSRLANRHQ